MLSGCQFLHVVGDEKHPSSETGQGQLKVELMGSTDLRGERLGNEDPLTDFNRFCKASLQSRTQPVHSKGPDEVFVVPILVGIALVAAFSVATTEAETSFARYADKKKQAFSFNTEHAGNVAALVREGRPTFNCLVIRLLNKDKPAEADLTFAATLKMSGATQPIAWQWVPTYFKLTKSSARTDRSGLVDVTVGIAISGVTEKGNQSVANTSIALKGLCLPGGSAKDCAQNSEGQWHDDNTKLPLGVYNATPWFIIPETDKAGAQQCKGDCVPGTITVSVTESGTGAPDFGAAKTELENTDKALATALGKYIDSQAPKK
ncbi:hypothetical protein BG60_26640 [Caballeronia zhejiangensis]|uniref:Uncharacterized protein n=1 Tax=Caballeronia zhejiangensis TaxID=871203 RepID=A0A656QFU1_9BURK|nr:hypothetical protein BURK_019220 [Burkholderia sp. SJ98]KAK43839.1 hypothetical protein BG58_29055 [Caballeronia jiangsuensis]KDR25889.1 hypothetical protein BG60_26640 [Caballeronia zhejiangensis]